MAQQVEEIFNDLIAEKENFSSLDSLAVPATDAGKTQAQQLVKNLNSKSTVAVWILITWAFAYMCRKIQVLWDRTKLELEQLAETAQPGTAQWLVAQAKQFRDGYSIEIDANYRAKYSDAALADLQAAIVTAAAVKDEFGVAILKVAKGLPGSYAPLSTEELERFRTYINDIRFAGQTISAVSRASDQLRLTVNVYYDGLVSQSVVSEASKQAVRDYLTKKLDFSGEVKVSAIIDAIQAVAGVKDVSITVIEAKKALGSYGTITRVYTTFSGYIKLDETSTFNMISQ